MIRPDSKSLFTSFILWLPLLLVMLVAGWLRFYHLGSLPFMHDEFSALFRTEYDSFSDLIRLGVAENDTHPAGVQVFLFYWVKIFGFNEFWVKFPFALAGLVSVGLLYLIGEKWFNETVALTTSAVMA
ncbi:MAG: glycosyltransferase family 39 protein, partial [Bacteroidales bacterium]